MPSLSKTAAKRQAHREARIFRTARYGWVLEEKGRADLLLAGLTFAAARRELAAWRFVRAVELSLYPLPNGNAVYQQLLSPFFPGVVFASAQGTAEAATALALAHARRVVPSRAKPPPLPPLRRPVGIRALRGEKGGSGNYRPKA